MWSALVQALHPQVEMRRKAVRSDLFKRLITTHVTITEGMSLWTYPSPRMRRRPSFTAGPRRSPVQDSTLLDVTAFNHSF